MAIAHPASSEAGPQPESNKKPKNQPETHVNAGAELETASPVAAPPVVSDAIPRGKRKREVDAASGVEGDVDKGLDKRELVIAGVDEASESDRKSTRLNSSHSS